MPESHAQTPLLATAAALYFPYMLDRRLGLHQHWGIPNVLAPRLAA